MNAITPVARKLALGTALAAVLLVVAGCIYNVPITTKPTHKVDSRLLGNWTSRDGKDKLKVLKLDDDNYIVETDGNIYRVWHSDVADTHFVTVQVLDSDTPKYSYWLWNLSEDGTLSLREVNDKIVPDDTKDSSAVRKLLKQNLQNPALFGDETKLTKDK